MTSPDPGWAGDLTERINRLNESMYRAGWMDAVKEITDLLVLDEDAGVGIDQQRVLAHLHAVGAKSQSVKPRDLLT